MSRIAKLRALNDTPTRPEPGHNVFALPNSSPQDTAYGLKALAGMCESMREAGIAGGRDTTLNNLCMRAGVLIRDGDLTRATAENALRQAAMGVTDPTDFTAYKVEEKLARVIEQGEGSGYVIQKAPLEPVPSLRDFTPSSPAVIDQTGAPVTNDVERTSWWPRDLGALLAGELEEEPAPAYLARTDGHRLFYAGKVNALIGESESGKTWVGLLTVAQALQVQERVLYLDFEDTLQGITARLRALGVRDDQLAYLTYISPDEDLDLPQRRDLTEAMQAHPPTLVLFDGVNAAMTLLGLDLEKNKDATEFSLRLLRPLKKTGACLVTIDHVTKSKDNRGSYAIGAQAKRADIDGCALMVEVVQPFGRGNTGRLKLTVSKDRPGHVRAVSAGAKNAGTAVLISSDDGTVHASIEAPDPRPAEERGPFRPTVLMERISRYLEAVPPDSDGIPNDTVYKQVQGGKGADQLPLALTRLIEEGYVTQSVNGQGHKKNRLIKPFRDDAVPPPSQVPHSPTGPPRSPLGDPRRSPTPPPPYRGGEGDLRQAPSDPSEEDNSESWWNK